MISRIIAAVVYLFTQLRKDIGALMTAIESLTAAVEKERTVTASAITLIQGLAAKIDAAKEDPDALEALAAEINSQSDALAAAVSANTPAVGKPADEEPVTT